MSAQKSLPEGANDNLDIPGYTLYPKEQLPTHQADEQMLGHEREVEVFELEHHVYSSPFRYKNVKVENWLEYGSKGIEMPADIGCITIDEKRPIISVTVVGSGCSGRNYNIVEWWGPGEGITRMRHAKDKQLIKRQRIDNLSGQHNAWIQTALTQEPPDFKSVEEAKDYLRRIQKTVYNMTTGYMAPGSLMTGLYENTAYFRIGDTSRPELTPYRVLIRGGGLDYEDPGTKISRYPAEYTFRLIDIAVKKNG